MPVPGQRWILWPGTGRSSGGSGERPAVVVVAADLLVVAGVAKVLVLVELRRVLDLFLGAGDVDLLLFGVDLADGPGGQQDVLAEDPDAGVHDEVGGAH